VDWNIYKWLYECDWCRVFGSSNHSHSSTEWRDRELILQNRRVTVNKIAKQLNISIGFAYSVVHGNLQFLKICAKWVPKELMDEHKHLHSTFLPASWLIITRKVTTFCNGYSQVMKPGFTSINQKPCEEHAMEASVIYCCKEIQDTTIGRQVNVHHLLRFSRACSWDLPGTWNNYHNCNLLWHASEKAEACNPL
jgi:hypothetical protein